MKTTKGPEYQEGSEARRKSTTAPKVERIEDRRCFKSSKGGLRGTYIAVEPFHLDRYLDEQMFRYNNRATKDNPITDADRFALAAIQIVGKRLTCSELTGKDGEAPFLPDQETGTREEEALSFLFPDLAECSE